MDYLEGVNLSPYTRSDNLLPLSEVFLIVSKVADALDYALVALHNFETFGDHAAEKIQIVHRLIAEIKQKTQS
jgi:hypothetical protein